ncbi:MAG: phosphonate C-P lyase system protein PhnH [Desulfitobacteriaceae bacterium]
MKLDLVHDIQAAFRKIVDAMSRPGQINSIKEQADKLDLESGCFNSTLVLALMLLDTEQTFHVVAARPSATTGLITRLTYAKAAGTERADYIFVLNDAKPEDIEKAFRAAYPGNLMNPHKSALIIIEADAVSNDRNLILTGPGIEKESYVKVKTTDHWVELRADKNSEYPLGVDLIFTDTDANILCIPRTTQVRKQGVNQWAMLQ